MVRIAFFGPVNSGKSTLVNAICGQEVSLVSPVPGTTTDPVRKRVELPFGIGPALVVDTAGLDDRSILGPERRRKTLAEADSADVAVVLVADYGPGESEALVESLEKARVPVVTVSSRGGESVESVLRRIAAALPPEDERFLTGSLVKEGDSVLLVMPQDSEAPKGRLILPQVNVLRELLDRGCVPHCCTPYTLSKAIASLGQAPDLVITDSQVFGLVDSTIPREWPLTSFSVLLAAAKGDVSVFVEGAHAIDTLTESSRVLIAEACTHVPDTEDIGRVKIPALLRKKAGAGLKVDISAGNDFPETLEGYDLVIHCGACVATAGVLRGRIRKALLEEVPITNYGIAIAKLQGILQRISIP